MIGRVSVAGSLVRPGDDDLSIFFDKTILYIGEDETDF